MLRTHEFLKLKNASQTPLETCTMLPKTPKPSRLHKFCKQHGGSPCDLLGGPKGAPPGELLGLLSAPWGSAALASDPQGFVQDSMVFVWDFMVFDGEGLMGGVLYPFCSLIAPRQHPPGSLANPPPPKSYKFPKRHQVPKIACFCEADLDENRRGKYLAAGWSWLEISE